MNRNIVGIVLTVMLGIILVESYFLFVAPSQSVSDDESAGLASQTPNSSSETEAADSQSPTDTLPSSQTSTDVSNGTSAADSVSFVPAVPEFTVELVDASYDVPTTYSTDPYTGTQVTHQGYHVAKRTIEIRIKNQPFTPYIDSNGRNITFYYNIRFKGHYVEWGSDFDVVYNSGNMPTQSNSEYTVIAYNSERTYAFTLGWVSRYLEVSPGGELDFQVKALVGYTYETVTGPGFHAASFTGEESDWSATQTLTIP